ncbi:MAG: adenylate cyclase, class 2 [Patescibacteria group bacterium]|jgi:adenylate cyclase class 2|nr:adenylate cyclase, class 2 [Patescibacteria group bacterium]
MEIEIKVKIEKYDNLKSFLEKEAKKKYINQQIDEYYTPAHKDFTKVDPIVEWLRLRDSDGKFSINYKHWKYEKDGRTHYCDEYESKVESIENLRKILIATDFKHLITVDKVRSVWLYKDYEISMDTVKGLGDFVEIEYKGNTENSVPSEITEQMIAFLNKIDCGNISRDFKGYPYLLLEQLK